MVRAPLFTCSKGVGADALTEFSIQCLLLLRVPWLGRRLGHHEGVVLEYLGHRKELRRADAGDLEGGVAKGRPLVEGLEEAADEHLRIFLAYGPCPGELRLSV